jgi:predicted DNA-binding ribbon-helix-helix protein
MLRELKQLAARDNISLASLIRGILTGHLCTIKQLS